MIHVFRKKSTAYIDGFLKGNIATTKTLYAKETSLFREEAVLAYNKKKKQVIIEKTKIPLRKEKGRKNKKNMKAKGPFFREVYKEKRLSMIARNKLKQSQHKKMPFSSKGNYTLHFQRTNFISETKRNLSTFTNRPYALENDVLSKKFTLFRLPFLAKSYCKHFIFLRRTGLLFAPFLYKHRGFNEVNKNRLFITNKRKISNRTTPFISFLQAIQSKKSYKRKKLKRIFKIKRRFFSKKMFSKRRSKKFLLSRKVRVLRKRGRFKLFNSIRKRLGMFRIYRKTYRRLPRKLRPLNKYLQARSVFFFRFRQHKARRRIKAQASTNNVFFNRYFKRKTRGFGSKKYANSFLFPNPSSQHKMDNTMFMDLLKNKLLETKLNTPKHKLLKKENKAKLSKLKEYYFPLKRLKRGRRRRAFWKRKYPLLWKFPKAFIKRHKKNDISYSLEKANIKNYHLKKHILNIKKHRYYKPQLFMKKLYAKSLTSFFTIMKKSKPYSLFSKKNALILSTTSSFAYKYNSSTLKKKNQAFLMRFPLLHPFFRIILRKKKRNALLKLAKLAKKKKNFRMKTRNKKLRLRRYKRKAKTSLKKKNPRNPFKATVILNRFSVIKKSAITLLYNLIRKKKISLHSYKRYKEKYMSKEGASPYTRNKNYK